MTRNHRLPIAARLAWIWTRRAKHRLDGHLRRHSVWPLATATGVIGIILLLLMHLSMLNAAVPKPDADGEAQPVVAEPEALFGTVPAEEDPPFEFEEEPPFISEPAFEAPKEDPEPWVPATNPDPPLEDEPPEFDAGVDRFNAHAKPKLPPWRVTPAVESPADPPQWDVEIERFAAPQSASDSLEQMEHQAEFVVDSSLTSPTFEGEVLLEQLDVLTNVDLSAPPQDDWNVFDVIRLQAATVATPYRGLLDPPDSEPVDYDVSSHEFGSGNAPSYRDLALSIVKEFPEAITADSSYEYRIVVRNDGIDTLDQFDVEEQLPGDTQVLAAVPDAHYANDRLRWRLRDLQPGDERIIAVTVLPQAEGQAEHTTAVIAEANVGAQTSVEGVRLEFDVEAPRQVEVGQWCPIRFRVTNTGSTEVTGISSVTIWVRWPPVSREKRNWQFGPRPWGPRQASRGSGSTTRLSTKSQPRSKSRKPHIALRPPKQLPGRVSSTHCAPVADAVIRGRSASDDSLGGKRPVHR